MILQNNQFFFYKAKMKHADLTHITLSWLKKCRKEKTHMSLNFQYGV